MLGFGPPANRRARQEWWRRQIQRQQEGSLSIAEFCRRLSFERPGRYRLEVRARTKPGTAVMDLREVKLTPVAKPGG